eukprot:748379-Hanusia_phi.AAC.2
MINLNFGTWKERPRFTAAGGYTLTARCGLTHRLMSPTPLSPAARPSDGGRVRSDLRLTDRLRRLSAVPLRVRPGDLRYNGPTRDTAGGINVL